MSLGVLNNISAIYAENNLNQTQSSLQNVLTQLSSGSRINSGADDADGLSLANGLQANSTALAQSATNASEGVGLLQVADGALSQVTSLLNRAVTLATESSNGTLNSAQLQAANQEYDSILAEINSIGATTTYNGQQVFGGGGVQIFTGDSTTNGSSTDTLNVAALSSNSVGDTGGTVQYTAAGGNVYKSAAQDPTGTYTGSLVFQEGATGTPVTVSLDTAGDTISQIATKINQANISGVSASVVSDGSSDGKYYLEVKENGANLQSFTAAGANDAAVAAGTATALAFAAPTAGTSGITYTAGTSVNLSTTNLTTGAQAALTSINSATSAVAAQRGYIGSQINTLNAISNVETTQQENVTSAQNAVQATDYASATSDMSKYEILSQTGISALAQANSTEQLVTKLLQ
ncbi:flagellin [Acidobacterium sp. S8]|uniref:flagellin N-terminal helical domain-containing protein n=1 Tax=Acidobacterium sp. S8 TaxID=1641854 RepID=UPI00131D7274|nr:flagellin [Acidobacterium sp. S8]